MKNFLQAMAILAVAYGLYQSGWIEGFGPRYPAFEREPGDSQETREDYQFEPAANQALSRTDEEALLADFETSYAPPNDCLGEPRTDRCRAHREDTFNSFRSMWEKYYDR
jgi:hypothetical protein